jgi:adenylate cyclase
MAREHYQRAVDRDPTFARAYSAMALTHAADHRYGWSPAASGAMQRALQLARQGAELDPELPQAHWVLAYVHVFRQEYEQALTAVNRAVELDPNYADSYLTLAVCKIHYGLPGEAVRWARKAMLLNPAYPASYASVLGQAYYFTGQYDQAVTVLRDTVDRNVNLLTAHVFLIAALNKLGQAEEAAWAATQLKAISPQFRRQHIGAMLPNQDPRAIEDITTQLRQAGL